MKKLLISLLSFGLISCHKSINISIDKGILVPVKCKLSSVSNSHYFNIQIKNNDSVIYDITRMDSLDTMLVICQYDSIVIKSLTNSTQEGEIISIKGNIGYNHCHNAIAQSLYYTKTYGYVCFGSCTSYMIELESNTPILKYSNTFWY